MTTENKDGSDYWNGPQGQNWVRFQEELDAVFADVTWMLLDQSELQAGENVLDIGCGTGAHTLAAADHVGEAGACIGVDISAPLVKLAKERAGDRTNVTFTLADAQTAGLPDKRFDIVTSRFGVMFFDDPPAAFANIATALKPGGRMVFGAWGPVPQNPWWHLPSRIAAERLGPVPAPPPNSPGPMGLSNVDYVRDVFQNAGLSHIEIATITAHLTHPDGAAGAASLSVNVGAAARVLDYYEAPEIDRTAVRDALAEAYATHEVDGTLRIPAAINVISARIA